MMQDVEDIVDPVAALLGLDMSDPLEQLAADLVRGDRQFLDELVRLRRDSKLTQQDVADQLGVTQGAVSQFETGERDPRMSTIRAYALAVGAHIRHEVKQRDDCIEGSPGAKLKATYTYPERGADELDLSVDGVQVVARGEKFTVRV